MSHPQQPEYGSSPYPQAPGGQPTPPGYGGQPDPSAHGGQPGYGEAQPGFAPAPPQKKKSGVGKILLIVLAVVLVLCIGGGIAIWATVGDDVGEVVEATNTRVVAPGTLNGRPKVIDPDLLKLSEQMATELKTDMPNATSAVGAFYGDPAKEDLVMIVGISGVMADPKKELDDAVTTLAGELGATNMAAVDPGPLGGEARCGDGKAEGIDVGICLWADRGSLGMVITYFKTGKQAEAEFGASRAAIEQRG